MMLKRPIFRLTLLAVVIAVGLGLYFWLGPRTPVVARPAMELPQ